MPSSGLRLLGTSLFLVSRLREPFVEGGALRVIGEESESLLNHGEQFRRLILRLVWVFHSLKEHRWEL